MFADAFEALLRDHCTPQVVRVIESGAAEDRHSAALWQAIAGAGFLELLRAESHGGAGASLAEAFSLFTRLGRHAVPLPVGESIAARALVDAGAELPGGTLTLAPAARRLEDGGWVCPLLPPGTLAEHVLAAADGQLWLLRAAQASRSGAGIAGSTLATLRWAPGQGHARVIAGDAQALPGTAAALYAALMTGALARVFELTLTHANQRSQFGRTLGGFQAVQHQLSVMAEQVAAASMAAEAAFSGAARTPALLAAAVAKGRSSEAAVSVANCAHALHGAIGITAEYELQLFTRRLHEWRLAHGSEAYWYRLIGERLLAGDRSVADFARELSSSHAPQAGGEPA